jgi:hypothetical protein
MKIKETAFSTFGLGILFPIQIQFLDIEGPKNRKIHCPTYINMATIRNSI